MLLLIAPPFLSLDSLRETVSALWKVWRTVFLLAHRRENFVGSFADDADVVGPSNGMEFNDAGKLFCEFQAHSDWNDLVICSVEDIDSGRRRTARYLAQRATIIVVLDQQIRQWCANHGSGFFPQCGKDSHENDVLY